ncbi:MAG: Fe-S cluster assembly ATPase SufC [Candidatus Moranbacteria bacterium]|nr:Fe-S cluster assembly ATPase SufC [Candidatus Moranbacteria bacterium]
MLAIKNLTVTIGDKEIIHSLSLSFAPGKTYVVLGPNGSGKSTLAAAIMGRPDITLSEASELMLDGESLKNLSADRRAALGLFLSFQSPLPIPGVSVEELLRAALDGKKDPVELHRELRVLAEEIGLAEEFLSRSIHDGFSGGERKKIEAVQAAVLSPKIAVFDEIDTGTDTDAVKRIADFLKKRLPADATRIFITHSPKLIGLIAPDHVVVLKDGRVAEEGDKSLAERTLQDGFEAETEVKSDPSS